MTTIIPIINLSKVQTKKNGGSYSGNSLEELVGKLSKYQEYFNRVVRNNIPPGILNTLVTLGVTRESFKKLDAVIKIILKIFDELLDEENKQTYSYKKNGLNIPIHFKNGSNITGDKVNLLKKYGIELDRSNENDIRAKVTHNYKLLEVHLMNQVLK